MSEELTTIAMTVSLDEGCWGMMCGPQQVAMPSGAIENHWVERFRVIRGDKIAIHAVDHGPAENFKGVPDLQMPSYGDDSIGWMMQAAEHHRHDTRWEKRRREMIAESTMIRTVLQQIEENRDYIANRSTFGPHVNKQRNVFDSNVPRRRLRDKRQAYSGTIPQGQRR